ncbi:MAG: MATE family efflux transporter [Spirochaetales bacterium]|nr:MATE family efflux transporter [Spirochaetales bacterium]
MQEAELTRKQPSLTARIIKIAFPVLIQCLISYVLYFTDTAFISRYNLKGLSAVNNALAPYFMFLSFFFALVQGATILIAQSLGAGKPEKAREYAEVAFFFNTFISIAYFFFWFFLGNWVLVVMGARDEVLTMGTTYITTLSFMFLVMGPGLTATAIFEGIGNTFPIMIASVVKSLLNIFLDWGLIFGNLFFPRWGVFGAAVATCISEYTGTILILCMVPFIKEFKVRLKGIFLTPKRLYLKIIKLGVPQGMEFMLWSLGQSVLFFMLNQIDALAAGVFGIINLLGMLFVNIYQGIGVAATNLVGKATGAGNPVEALKAGNTTVAYSLLVCTVISVLFIFFPGQILSFFTTEPELIRNLITLLWILTITSFPRALNIVAGNAIRGTGNTVWMMLTQIGGTIGVVACTAVFLFVFNWGMTGVVFAVFLDELWRGVVNYVKFAVFDHRKRMRALQPEVA